MIDWEKKENVKFLASYAENVIIILDQGIIDRAQQLESIGFKSFDALHVASAEEGKVDLFLTTDD